MLLKRFMFFSVAALIFAQPLYGQLVISELHSKSQIDPEDFFEITNTGLAAVDITGWQFDDESALLADAAPLEGITNIDPGETVVFFQLNENDPMDPGFDPAGETMTFRNYWGGLSGVQVGYYGGAGLGKGDAVNVFDDMGNIVLSQEYGMTVPNQTHAGDWAANNTDGSDTFENQSAIWVPGTMAPPEFVLSEAGVLGSFANLDGDFGSPGVIVPEPLAGSLLIWAMLTMGVVFRRR